MCGANGLPQSTIVLDEQKENSYACFMMGEVGCQYVYMNDHILCAFRMIITTSTTTSTTTFLFTLYVEIFECLNFQKKLNFSNFNSNLFKNGARVQLAVIVV